MEIFVLALSLCISALSLVVSLMTLNKINKEIPSVPDKQASDNPITETVVKKETEVPPEKKWESLTKAFNLSGTKNNGRSRTQ